MDYLGLDIARAKFDAHLLAHDGQRHASFANTQAGFEQLATWLGRHYPASPEAASPEAASPDAASPDAASPAVDVALHACLEATGNWGLELAAFLHASGVVVSIVNPRQVKAFADSELSRNKTDRLDAALIARFARSHRPPAWTPPLAHMRELRELVRRCAALKASRTQESNRSKAGAASDALAASIARMLAHIEAEITQITRAISDLIAQDRVLHANFALLCSVTGIGATTAALILAELPNIAEFTPKALAAFAGLSPQEHSSGTRAHRTGISRIGNPALRSALYLCALSARRHNKPLSGFAKRLTEAGKPNKVVLIALARKLLVLAHAVIRTQTPFNAEA